MSKKTVIIKPGETIILPKGTKIDSLILDGDINVESSCNNLPEPSSYKCGYFYYILDVDDNSGHSMDELSTSYEALVVGENTYTMNYGIVLGDNPGTLVDHATLNVFVTDQVLFSFKQIVRTVLSKKQLIRAYFKVPESLFDLTYLIISNGGSYSRYYPIEATCDSYPTP